MQLNEKAMNDEIENLVQKFAVDRTILDEHMSLKDGTIKSMNI